MDLTFGPTSWALAGLGAVAALAYGLWFLDKPPSWPRALLKTVPLAALAGAFCLAGAHPLLVLALAASAAGDFLLAFDKPWILPLGILSFLAAQMLYILIFLGLAIGGGDGAWPMLRFGAMAIIVIITIAFLIWMAPKLGWMALGVVPYAAAISAMACMAIQLPWSGWPAMLGAASFLVSDLVLSAELFRLPADAPARRITRPLVWWSYIAAQTLIVWGIAAAG
jgi:uncharacterized membrane protein YhhN